MGATMNTITTARQFVDGELVSSPRETKSLSPDDGSVLGEFADADGSQGAQAVSAARRAFADSDWSRDRQLRNKVLLELADAVDGRSNDLITMLAGENGKVLGEAGF